ncbi:MAG: thioredoxin-disulfide reductase [Actinomycetia bacterium]|nr:thioredoxin-disulfide reductase [Actinomycetes bacterium]
MTETVLIIGSGPAGLTAAIYAARADLEPFMIEGMERGGQLMITTDVENYPGFPDGVMGPDLMEQMRKQAERFGTRIVSSDVTDVDFSQRPFTVSVGQDTYSAQSIIISTGASARWLGVEGEERLRGFGVSACATCDGFFFRDKELLIVGGGDTAMEEALFLTKFASKVTVVHRRDEFRASRIMVDRVLEHPKIDVLWDSVVVEIVGDTLVTGAKIRNVKTDEVTDFEADGVFVAIGHTPNTKVFAGEIDLDEDGYVLTEPGATATSVEGVFAAGDVTDKVYRQAVTAAGLGCQAALDAQRWLHEQS